MDGMQQLPTTANAPLPATYESAKVALAECQSIDECQTWADKAAALASYGRQANDNTLVDMALRIQARASRRAGELLKQFDARVDNARKQTVGDHSLISQREVAAEAGMSEYQQATAVRIANVPQDTFERMVESPSPPTKTALADIGKKTRPLVDLGDRSEADFKTATQAQGQVREFAKHIDTLNPAAIARGSSAREIAVMRPQIEKICAWLDVLAVTLTE